MSLRQKDYIIAALAIGGPFVSPFKGWLGAVMLLAALALYNIWWRCPHCGKFLIGLPPSALNCPRCKRRL